MWYCRHRPSPLHNTEAVAACMSQKLYPTVLVAMATAAQGPLLCACSWQPRATQLTCSEDTLGAVSVL